MSVSRSEVERRVEALIRTCRARGMKVTHQRMEIFREVAGTEEHPDAETVYRRVRKRLPTVSHDTVYRSLYALEELGLISRVEVLTDRVRFDGNTRTHHHLVCTACGTIQDFESADMDALRGPRRGRSWGEVRSVHVELRGICSKCLGRRRAK